jgi:hypothetical protein
MLKYPLPIVTDNNSTVPVHNGGENAARLRSGCPRHHFQPATHETGRVRSAGINHGQTLPVTHLPIYIKRLHLGQIDKCQRVGSALGDTGRFQTFIKPINAEITFDHFTGKRIKLWNTPRTGSGTGHAADAFVLIKHYNAVFPLSQSANRADFSAVWIIALITAAKRKFRFRYALD